MELQNEPKLSGWAALSVALYVVTCSWCAEP